jgi:hypothetical protein
MNKTKKAPQVISNEQLAQVNGGVIGLGAHLLMTRYVPDSTSQHIHQPATRLLPVLK